MTAELAAAAAEVVRLAGAVLRRAYSEPPQITHKGTVDLVTSADRAAEECILQFVGRRFAEHSVLAEESGAHEAHGSHRWIVDPLDGTVNFAHKLPHFCVTVAVQERREHGWVTSLGATYDPLRDELFEARVGAGARLNGSPIGVSSAARLIDAVAATGFAYDRLTACPDNHREFDLLNLVTRGVRRFGSAALDLAYVACGRFDLYWEYALKPWDAAAGALLVSEAGGSVSARSGSKWELDSELMLATNGVLHAPLAAALETALQFPANHREAVRRHLPPDLARVVVEPVEPKP